ncbi:MAG: hypothetical protein IJ725_05280 [Ruminococcus sp.]|nr:hypothetical protein [Ruminococcus sp.]
MTDNQEHNDVNDYNSIDLNELYNLNRCIGGRCVSNTVPAAFPAPTIEQIVRDPGTNIERNIALQTAANEVAFADASPISGVPSEMYQPITRAQSELYPTPAVVQEEIEQNDRVNNPQNINDTAEDLFVPYEVTRESLQYLNGFIRTQIGRRVTIDFLLGSDTLTSKSGYLLAVAQNYLLLNELDTNDVTACDIYTMKFIRFYY